MNDFHRFEQAKEGPDQYEFSLSKFFHDAYEKGIVTSVKEHPEEFTAACSTVAVLSAGVAFVCFPQARAQLRYPANRISGTINGRAQSVEREIENLRQMEKSQHRIFRI